MANSAQGQRLTEQGLYRILKETFPAQNDFHNTDYCEELQELSDFGITSPEQLKGILDRHSPAVLEYDSDPLGDFHEQHYKSEYGEAFVNERVKGGFWFAYPALLRIALELEFGDRYREYANRRDGV
ncbi:hypothetical protein [Flaviaesturariibacter amylovorans]|uniref:Uncharacterized protein n=1 Tax=Flaviaesturariibacter amylovorans TaxID=1084520 RepID=A0ABP8G4K0_9BACT